MPRLTMAPALTASIPPYSCCHALDTLISLFDQSAFFFEIPLVFKANFTDKPIEGRLTEFPLASSRAFAPQPTERRKISAKANATDVSKTAFWKNGTAKSALNPQEIFLISKSVAAKETCGVIIPGYEMSLSVPSRPMTE